MDSSRGQGIEAVPSVRLVTDEGTGVVVDARGSFLRWMGTCFRKGEDKSISGSLRLGLKVWFYIPGILERVVEDACVGHFRVLALTVSGFFATQV